MSNRAFTLSEAAAILLIIGLVAGAIVIGHDIIKAAEVRAQVAQLDEYNKAAVTFKAKYQCLPGDCENAVELGLGTQGGAGANGDGNGKLDLNIEYTVSYNLSTPEPSNFWYHLARAQLIAGNYPGYDGTVLVPGVDTPALKLKGKSISYDGGGAKRYHQNLSGGFCIFVSEDARNYTVPQDIPIFEHHNDSHVFYLSARCQYHPSGVYDGRDAYALDSKADDGLPKHGNMRAIFGGLMGWVGYEQITAGGDCYIPDPDLPRYNLRDVSYTEVIPLCSMVVLTDF